MLGMAQQYLMKKEAFNSFVAEVMKEFELIAPIKGDETKLVLKTQFSKITAPEQVFLDKITTYFPAKYFFTDKKEVLLSFEGNNIRDPTIKLSSRVIFGLRRCDLNSIKLQDMVFLDPEHEIDPFYKARREATTLIGFHCKEGDEYCFCNSFPLEDFFDLMFYDKNYDNTDVYAIEVGSEKGQQFVDKYKQFFEEKNDAVVDVDKNIKLTKNLEKTDINDLYNREEWETKSKECLSCGACNHLCPNCHCFEIKDEVDFSLKNGKRVRVPAACQSKTFTRVAGDHIFRETRVSRFKHRIFHQIQYFKDRHGVNFCTGCGRCIRGCPTRIDWVDTINSM